MLSFFLLAVCVLVARTQVATRVAELDINAAVTADFLTVISGLNVYRDELVLLDTYSGIISVRTDELTVVEQYFDRINITHVYATVDDDTGLLGMCTNKAGRCQYMNVTTLDVLGYGDGLMSEGEQDVEVDIGVSVLLANSMTSVPSLFIASGNAVTIGRTGVNPEYPIRTAQLQNSLAESAVLPARSRTETFRRSFIATFKSGGFVYFVTGDDNRDIIITRICESDSLEGERYHSLYQTTLTPCVAATLPKVLHASLSYLNNGTEYVVITYQEQSTVSVCAYSLSSINSAITGTYENCVVNGIGTVPEVTLFLSPTNTPCSEYSGANNTECNLWPAGSVNAFLSFVTDAVTGSQITSIAGVSEELSVGSITTTTTSVSDSGNTYYYMFITKDNYIDKYLMNGLSLVDPAIERLTFSERITGAETDQSGERLFAITNSRLLRIPLSDCERYETCSECVSDRDPLCGWCTVQNSCTRQSLCSYSNLTHRWIPDNVTVCLNVTGVDPNESYINTDTTVTLSAVNLPELAPGEKYVCRFGNLTTDVVSVNADNSLIGGPVNGTADIQCPAPTGLMAFSSDRKMYSLSLSTENYPIILSDATFQYTIIDCSYHTLCSNCADTSECGWCLYNSVCTGNVSDCVMGEWVQPADAADLCPVIDRVQPDSFEVPALEDSSIIADGSNLPEPTTLYNYRCEVAVEGNVSVVAAEWQNGTGTAATISCLVKAENIPVAESGSLEVIWGPTYRIENSSLLNFTAFICGNLPDCVNCLENSACSWCTDNSTGTCSSECGPGMNVFTPSDTCPAPVITEFTPNSTAAGGAVVVDITGYNLKVRDGPVSVMIGETDCGIITSSIDRISCSLEAPENTSRTNQLNVSVAGVDTISTDTFSISIPVITSVSPSFTPQYGGSVITLVGQNLLLGASRVLTAGTECVINSETLDNTDDVITCVTSSDNSTIQSGVARTTLMTITIDTHETSYTDEVFTVLEDPQVTNLFLSGANSELRVTFQSGFLDYELTGRNLGATLTQVLEFYTEEGNLISSSTCTPPTDSTSGTLMCPGAQFSGASIPDSGMVVRLELIMDAVPNIAEVFSQVFSVVLYPDPELTDNSTIQLIEGDTSFSMEITNIDKVPSEVVSVRRSGGADLCSLVTLSENSLQCELNYTDTGMVTIEIQIGINENAYILTRELNILQKSAILKTLQDNMVVLIAVGALILITLLVTMLLLCVCCCCLYRARRRNKLKEEEAEHLLSEMEDIENDLAEKCRKGFAELNTQIEMEEGLLDVGRIPLHPFKTFAMRILFPGLQDHPVLHPVEKPSNQDADVFNKGLQKFEGLLRDKQFLAVMLHAMEDNRNFSIRDRCNVASLLTIALYQDMPFLTEVLFELLEELINKNVTKNTSKLLLRRTESVAEKLLADWLAFNLFHHLQAQPSIAMYKMFLGIKGHLESGPVDVLSGRAANSLSEEKLMRHDISYEKLDVEAESSDGSRVPCRLLDCDTISQTKIKLMDHIYRGVGYSQRPKLEDVEVVLLSAGGGRLQLRDNDMTNEGDEEWRQINTLQHYCIKQGMLLTVVPRKQNPNPGQVWDYPGTCIYDFGHTQTLSCLLSIDEGAIQVFHLHKSEEAGEYEQTKTLRRRQYGSEIFLPKLVATKRILQSYIDQMVEEIFPHEQKRLEETPKAIKLLYDFLDEQAVQYGIEGDDVTHTWKSNSVPLRFWVNLLKNPEFLLDVSKSASLDAALSVISQAFIDSCSSSDSQISRESPTNKILYHKEVQQYKVRVKNYYEFIKNAPKLDRNALTFQSADLLLEGEKRLFYEESAAYGLFSYAQSYQEEIKTRLCNDSLDSQQQIFEEVCYDISENLYSQ